ncbi:MAG: hypothetical protein K2L50_01860 [Bacteroidales bacterium]|nr:hypothetical protein [Bacteroidales bacterium]
MERNEIKLYDVSYQAQPISAGSRLETYWLQHFTRLEKGVNVRRFNYKNLFDNKLGPVSDNPHSVMMYYKLKGFQFGNWVKQIDRVNHFGGCALALADLRMLMHSKNLGFDHNIGVAFGARGQAGAAAHYEPRLMMINLTKQAGAGCLAHEYGHALDYFFGMRVDVKKGGAALSNGDSVSKTIIPCGGVFRHQMAEVLKRIVATESYETWRKYHKKRWSYWGCHTEMFARCFEQWCCWQLRQKKIENTYLSYSWKYYQDTPSRYLSVADCKKVFPAITKLVALCAKEMNRK